VRSRCSRTHFRSTSSQIAVGHPVGRSLRMVATTPVTPYPSPSRISRRADGPVTHVLPVVQRLARASVRNLAPAALYFAVSPTCIYLADLAGVSATWPRHWLLAATAAASTVLARRLRARPATIACGAVTASSCHSNSST
jgi:hypothetical protein